MGKKKSKQIFERSIGKKAIAWVLVFSIFFQTLTVSAQEVFEESPNPILEETETEEEETSIEGMKILLVEDNDLNLEVAQYILEDAGAEIIVARNGLESVELFEQSESDSFDVILMDVMMPVMDGLTATKRIRKLKRKDARTVPVIAMTANVFNEDIIAAKEAGMNEHIAKPLDFDKLIHTLAKYFLKMDKKLIS